MQKTPFDLILDQIARASRITPMEVRENLRLAMISALKDPTPAVQAMWDSVPKKGDTPTLEEFMEYLIQKNMVQP